MIFWGSSNCNYLYVDKNTGQDNNDVVVSILGVINNFNSLF